jgi:hypothetical protein
MSNVGDAKIEIVEENQDELDIYRSNAEIEIQTVSLNTTEKNLKQELQVLSMLFKIMSQFFLVVGISTTWTRHINRHLYIIQQRAVKLFFCKSLNLSIILMCDTIQRYYDERLEGATSKYEGKFSQLIDLLTSKETLLLLGMEKSLGTPF